MGLDLSFVRREERGTPREAQGMSRKRIAKPLSAIQVPFGEPAPHTQPEDDLSKEA
jgi:hypothetical protein